MYTNVCVRVYYSLVPKQATELPLGTTRNRSTEPVHARPTEPVHGTGPLSAPSLLALCSLSPKDVSVWPRKAWPEILPNLPRNHHGILGDISHPPFALGEIVGEFVGEIIGEIVGEIVGEIAEKSSEKSMPAPLCLWYTTIKRHTHIERERGRER